MSACVTDLIKVTFSCICVCVCVREMHDEQWSISSLLRLKMCVRFLGCQVCTWKSCSNVTDFFTFRISEVPMKRAITCTPLLVRTCIETGFNFCLIDTSAIWGKTCQTKEQVLLRASLLWRVEGSCVSVTSALSAERQLVFLIETNTNAICHLASVSSATFFFLQHKHWAYFAIFFHANYEKDPRGASVLDITADLKVHVTN